jgi:hypothetical protein
MTGTSMRKSCDETASGAMRPQIPRINSTLKMLLPTTLAIAISGEPVAAA